MNSGHRLDVIPRSETYHGVYHFADSWSLKLFTITVTSAPFDRLDQAQQVLMEMVRSITDRLSSEFEYGRFGFTIVHEGRRGICITVTHFGRWGTTFETFSSVWYRYGHSFDGFALLDDVEPALCWFEVARSFEEIRAACELAREGSLSEIRTRYLAQNPRIVPANGSR